MVKPHELGVLTDAVFDTEEIVHTEFLSISNVSKHFGGVIALDGVDLRIRCGEIHCLAGENGSGKSTLIKIISGVHGQTSGSVKIEGSEISHWTPAAAIEAGIQVIYQDFAVFPNLTVAENIAMNKSIKEGAKVMSWKEAREIAKKALAQVGSHLDVDLPVERLSVANKQIVAICRAIITDAKLLILDEPTTALTASEVQKLNAVIRNLKEQGMAIVIVNHKLPEIYDVADVLTIIRNGKTISSGSISEYNRSRFVREMTGRDLEVEKYEGATGSNEVLLELKNFTKKGSFQNVSFQMNKGDILGITGLLGSGRGEIGEALFGTGPADSGEVYLAGKNITIRSVADAMREGIAYVPEDRLTQGLFMTRSIQDNTVAASVSSYLEKGKINYKKMFNDTADWIKKIGCKAPSPTPAIRTLSGGNAQKIVIAKWLNTNPKLLILNGPTVGVDVGAKADIHRILRGLAADGVGVIIISDDISELVENCNKMIVMHHGEASKIYEAKDLDEETLTRMLSTEEEK